MLDRLWSVGLVCALSALLPACSGDDDSKSMDSSANPAAMAGDAQTPPTSGGADVEAWLKQGDYQRWTCETVDHPQLKVSPHGQNRVCSNTLAAAFTGGPNDERPKGTAAVKELFDDSSQLVGYAVGVKVADTSDGGANWYWYERTPMGTVADGLGSSGAAKSICVGCHAGAGSNDAHDVMGSSDYVYLQAQ